MGFEVEIIKWMQTFSDEITKGFFTFWTMFGEELIIIAIMGFIYWCFDKKAGEFIGFSVFVSLVLNSVIKIAIKRVRPFDAFPEQINNWRGETAGGYSFPSGHTQGAASVFGSAAVWIKKRWLSIAATVIIIMVAISRMYLGAHYLTDVIVGGLLGIGIAFLIHYLFKKIANRNRIYITTMIGSVILLLIVFFTQTQAFANDAQNFYSKLEGLFKMEGAFIGFVFGIMFEKKQVNFTMHKVLWKNILRFIIGVAIVMGIRYSLSFLFDLIINPENLGATEISFAGVAMMLDFIRYGIMVFIAIGVYPLVFKKLKI
ncbi:MAG: phosphatase PAP2 family protein [Candidatus Izemoplasmatales bacterium]|jgi:membrane-associated phospholipid phosphatase|nr:phosphatase PAP2 family protein [Candidatus Izemoplasmatales bacterium]